MTTQEKGYMAGQRHGGVGSTFLSKGPYIPPEPPNAISIKDIISDELTISFRPALTGVIATQGQTFTGAVQGQF